MERKEITKEKGFYMIPFQYAKWQVKCLTDSLETQIKLAGKYAEFLDNSKRAVGSRDHLSFVKGQIKVWKSIMYASCPKHEFEIRSGGKTADGDVYEIRVCKNCGYTLEEVEEDGIETMMYPTYDNCSHYQVDGGDSVPYGMGSANLPMVCYCYCQNADAETLFGEDEMTRKCGNRETICPYWEGR